MNLTEQKTALRRQIGEMREKISLAVRTVESMELCARLEPQLRSAHTILFYAPLPEELDVWPLLEKFLATGKVCALPVFNRATKNYVARRVKNLETDVAIGHFNVSEPLPACEEIPFNRFDLILVPGVAFDLQGNRLGRGKGFYDQILSAASGMKCGVAYEFQLLEKIPAEAHDMRVNFIATPTRCVKAAG